jgi:curved DNA-binding protein CbpA
VPVRTHYDILGVSVSANTVEIKIAYRVQAMQWHPDRNSSPDAAARFREVKDAYECLANPEARRRYDAALRGEDAGYGFQSRASGCTEDPECLACMLRRLWVDVHEQLTVRPEQLVALFEAIERWITLTRRSIAGR